MFNKALENETWKVIIDYIEFLEFEISEKDELLSECFPSLKSK
jgi:hypothetical protein